MRELEQNIEQFAQVLITSPVKHRHADPFEHDAVKVCLIYFGLFVEFVDDIEFPCLVDEAASEPHVEDGALKISAKIIRDSSRVIQLVPYSSEHFRCNANIEAIVDLLSIPVIEGLRVEGVGRDDSHGLVNHSILKSGISSTRPIKSLWLLRYGIGCIEHPTMSPVAAT